MLTLLLPRHTKLPLPPLRYLSMYNVLTLRYFSFRVQWLYLFGVLQISSTSISITGSSVFALTSKLQQLLFPYRLYPLYPMLINLYHL